MESLQIYICFEMVVKTISTTSLVVTYEEKHSEKKTHFSNEIPFSLVGESGW